jgi:hypothetical protein
MLGALNFLSSKWGSVVYIASIAKTYLFRRSLLARRASAFRIERNLVEKDVCEELIEIIKTTEPWTSEGIFNPPDEKSRFLAAIRLNSVFYFSFPHKVLVDYRYVKAPLNHPRVRDVCERLLVKLEELLGSNLILESVELYATHASGGHENSRWHIDGDHRTSARLLVYLSDVIDDDDGPLVIRDEYGTDQKIFLSAGSGVFFYASREFHMGLSPRRSARYCLNVKVYPSIGRTRIRRGACFVNRMTSLFRI